MTAHDRRTKLVHICGFGSGGTTLLLNIMNTHPEIELANELPLLPQLAHRFDAQIPGALVLDFAGALQRGDLYRQLRNSRADLSTFVALQSVSAEEIFSLMLTQANVRWKGYKNPYNIGDDIRRLLHLFPESYFILIIRDVRDICLSWRRKWGKHVLLSAEKWRTRMLQASRSLAALPKGRGMVIRYEELLRDTECVTRQICQFLDIPFDSRMLSYHSQIPKIIDGHKNYGQPIDPGNVGNWRSGISPREIKRIEEIAYETMVQLGYQPQFSLAARPISTVERLIGLGTDCFAMVFVGNRYKLRGRLLARITNIRITLRRRAWFV